MIDYNPTFRHPQSWRRLSVTFNHKCAAETKSLILESLYSQQLFYNLYYDTNQTSSADLVCIPPHVAVIVLHTLKYNIRST